ADAGPERRRSNHARPDHGTLRHGLSRRSGVELTVDRPALLSARPTATSRWRRGALGPALGLGPLAPGPNGCGAGGGAARLAGGLVRERCLRAVPAYALLFRSWLHRGIFIARAQGRRLARARYLPRG